MNNKIIELNEALTDAIVKSCKGKYQNMILTTLTAGMDTRVILSILLNNGIKPHCMTHDGWDIFGKYKDIRIASKIAKDFHLVHTVINKQPNAVDYFEELFDVLQKYEVVFYGEKMSEVFNKYNRFMESEKKLNSLEIPDATDYPNKVYPITNSRVQNLVKNIPIYYRMHGYLHRKLIAMNCKELLRYPHTYYNLKYTFAEILHRMVVR